MTIQKFKFKLLRLWMKIQRRLPFPGRGKKQVYLRDRIKQYEDIWQAIADDTDSVLSRLDRDIWQLTHSGKTIRMRLHQFPLDNDVTLRLCGRKYLVHKMLSEQNIPVPAFSRFKLEDLRPARDFLSKHPHGVVIKPSDGYAGLGVTTHITSQSQLEKAALTASLYLDDFMIEEQIVGENFRLLIYKGKMLNAVRRSGQHILGNGTSTISQLLLSDNPAEQFNDQDLLFTLHKQSLDLSTVPGINEKILVRSVGRDFNGGAELRTVYDCDVTDEVEKSVIKHAIKCAEIVQADLVGIDIITTDITKSLQETHGIINEVNTTPALHHHYNDATEPYPRAALIIAKDLLGISCD